VSASIPRTTEVGLVAGRGVLNLEAVDLTQLFRRLVLIAWHVLASAVLAG